MEVSDASREVDTCFSTDSVEGDDANSELNDDTPKNEPRADDITGGDEKSVDARSTNDELCAAGPAPDSSYVAGEEREEIADSSQAASEDRRIESSEAAMENAGTRHVTQTPLAFTIDFGNNKEVDTARYQNLFERYNARHRRNLSTSKVYSQFCRRFYILLLRIFYM